MRKIMVFAWSCVGSLGILDGALSFLEKTGLIKYGKMNEVFLILKEISSISTPLLVMYLVYLYFEQNKLIHEQKENNITNEIIISKLNDRCKLLVEQLVQEKGINVKIPKINLSTHDKNLLSSLTNENRTKILNSQWDSGIYTHEKNS